MSGSLPTVTQTLPANRCCPAPCRSVGGAVAAFPLRMLLELVNITYTAAFSQLQRCSLDFYSLFLLAACCSQFPGGSFAAHPLSTLLYSAPVGPDVTIVELNPSEPSMAEYMERNLYIKERRPALYGPITAPQ